MLKGVKKAVVVLLLTCLPIEAYGEREELSESPALRDLIQQKFEDIKEFRLRLHRWERSTRGFRRDHNFSLNLSTNSGDWKGVLPSSTSDAGQSFEYSSSRYMLRGGYAFHLELGRGFGYYLGTGIGISLEDSSSQDGFIEPNLLELPGIQLGLVWNISPALRLSTGGNLHLVRIDKFEHNGSSTQTTGRALSKTISLDIFLSISSGVRLQYQEYELYLKDSKDVVLERIEKGVTIGWVRHLI